MFEDVLVIADRWKSEWNNPIQGNVGLASDVHSPATAHTHPCHSPPPSVPSQDQSNVESPAWQAISRPSRRKFSRPNVRHLKSERLFYLAWPRLVQDLRQWHQSPSLPPSLPLPPGPSPLEQDALLEYTADMEDLEWLRKVRQKKEDGPHRVFFRSPHPPPRSRVGQFNERLPALALSPSNFERIVDRLEKDAYYHVCDTQSSHVPNNNRRLTKKPKPIHKPPRR